MAGVRVRHETLRSCVALVPVLAKPFKGQSLDRCPTCFVVHPCKTVHLWLDDAGTCIVSRGVLEELRMAGMPQLQTLEEIKNPPPLALGVRREKQDQEARYLIVSR